METRESISAVTFVSPSLGKSEAPHEGWELLPELLVQEKCLKNGYRTRRGKHSQNNKHPLTPPYKTSQKRGATTKLYHPNLTAHKIMPHQQVFKVKKAI